MFYKRIISIIIIIIFFMAVWYTQSRYLLSNASLDTLIYLNNSANGFNSVMAYTVMYTIPYLLFYRQFFQEEAVLMVTRYDNRERFLKRMYGQILLATLIFIFAMLFVHFFMTMLYFEKTVLIDANFLVISVINSLSLYFFYVIVGLFYLLVNTKVKRKTHALLIVFAFFSLHFFIEKLFLVGRFRTILTEISLFSKYYYQDLNLIELLLKSGYLFLISLILYSITTLAYSRKDYLGE